MDGLRHGRLPLKQRPLPPLVVALAAALALLLLVVVTPTATAFVHHGRIPSIGPLQQQQQRRGGFAPRPPTPPPLRAIKGVETFGGDFTLSPESEAVLVAFLEGEEMKAEVLKQARCTSAAFTGKLFQPVPYSPGTPHGMPPQFEVFYQNPQYAICHVPPPVMFKARVFTPPRLCAVFEIAGVHPEEVARIEAAHRARMPVAEQLKHLEDRGPAVPADEVVRRIKGPENDWRSVGRALRDVVLEGLGNDEDDDPELDALVV